MRSYGRHPMHTPSAGPRQPQLLKPNDATTHAERERALAVIADVAGQVRRGVLPADDEEALQRPA